MPNEQFPAPDPVRAIGRNVAPGAVPLYRSRLGQILLLLHGVCVGWAFLIGLADGTWGLFLSWALWTGIAAIGYGIRPAGFLVVAFALAVVEEALIYGLGGGLQGKATSLLDDFRHALPVLGAIVLGWYLALRRWRWSETAVLVGAGLHGFVLEFLTTGLVLNPVAVALLGPPTLFIYGSLVLVPKPPTGPGRPPLRLAWAVLSWVGTLILMMTAAIIADQFSRKA